MTLRAILRSPWRLAALGASGLLLVNAAVYLGFTRPRQDRSRRMTELSAEMGEALKSERAEVERLRRRARIIEANRRDKERFLSETIRPQSEALPEDLDALEEVFKQAGLYAERRNFSRAELRDLPIVRLDHQVTVSGRSDRLAEFLRLIERSPRFILVSGIRLRQETNGRGRLEATLATYYRGEADAAAARVASR